MIAHNQHKSICPHCSGTIAFSSQDIWTKTSCPHCQKTVQLGYASLKRSHLLGRVLPLLGVCLIFVAIALTITFIPHKQTQPTPPPPPAAQPDATQILNEFHIGQLRLEKAQNNDLIYATGTARSLVSRPRFGVRIELDLLDQKGEKVGTASDYLAVLEPDSTWRFQALVTETSALALKLSSILETP